MQTAQLDSLFHTFAEFVDRVGARQSADWLMKFSLNGTGIQRNQGI